MLALCDYEVSWTPPTIHSLSQPTHYHSYLIFSYFILYHDEHKLIAHFFFTKIPSLFQLLSRLVFLLTIVPLKEIIIF